MGISAIPTNFDAMVANEAGRHATPVALPPDQTMQAELAQWGEDGFGFGDVLDVVNPLHHLPVVGDMYRDYTGDSIAPAAKIIGGMIFGGPVGLVVAIFNAIFEEATGKDIGSAVADLFTGEDEATTQLAEAAPAVETAPAPAPATLAAIAPAAGNPGPAQELPAIPSMPAPSAGAPQLSPQAFEALVRSFNGAPPRPVARAGVQAGAETPQAGALPPIAPLTQPVGRPTPLLLAPQAADAAAAALDDRRQAALDLHQQLRAYAEQKGVPVKDGN